MGKNVGKCPGKSVRVNRQILIVDDDRNRLTLLRSLLKTRGYQVHVATDATAGLDCVEHHPIDLAVLDYYMPVVSGGVLALELRRTHPQIPIVIFSGALTLPDRIMALIDGFISASEDEPEALLEKIAEILEGRQHGMAQAS